MDEPFDLTPSEAAKLVGFHPRTLKRWAHAGRLDGIRTPGGYWRFRRSDVLAVLNPKPRVVPVCMCHTPKVDRLGECQTCHRKPLDMLRRPS